MRKILFLSLLALVFAQNANADTDANSVIISQSFPDTAKLLKESHKGTLKNASTKQWTVSVPANGKTTLSFTVQIPQDTRICD